MTKKERVIAAIKQENIDFVPSSFSLHFPSDKAFGDSGIKSHLNFFKESDTDIYKVMNENMVPDFGKKFDDYRDYNRIPVITMKDSFMAEQIDFTKRIVDSVKDDVFFCGTLHGACASAIHPLRSNTTDYHARRSFLLNALRTYPNETFSAMQRITDAMCILSEQYIKAGMDGIYYAALGGENMYFTDEEFEKYIAPLDKQILKTIHDAGGYSFLHICKKDLNMIRYNEIAQLADVVNWGVYEVPYTLEQGKKLFAGKTIMGGLENRTGVLVDGTDEEIRITVKNIINSFGKKGFILGADCTLSTEQDMHRLRVAVEAARTI